MKLTDGDGNSLLMGDNAIFLKLKGEPRLRTILSFEGGRIVKRVSQQHVMRINGGMIGFNYNALKMIREKRAIKKKIIAIQYKKIVYNVPVEELIDKGIFLHFKNQGFELQIFYPIKELSNWT